MAKRGALTHRKTRILADALGIQVACALGIMEGIWHVTATHARAGNIGRLSNRDIALELFWTDDVDTLVDALVTAGILDEYAEHRLIVHGWAEHADDSVHRALGRACEMFADGTAPTLTRLTKEEKEAATATYAKLKRAHGGRTTGARNAPKVRKNSTPCALPSLSYPSPALPSHIPPNPPGGERADSFETFWQACPKKVGKADARKAWGKLAPDAELAQTIAAAMAAQAKNPRWLEDDGRYCPHPARWLNAGRWEDEVKFEPSADDEPPGPFVWSCPNPKCSTGAHEALGKSAIPPGRRCPEIEAAHG